MRQLKRGGVRAAGLQLTAEVLPSVQFRRETGAFIAPKISENRVKI